MKMILWRFLGFALAFPFLTTPARANVYATDVKLNGSRSLTNAVPAGSVNISYILNEPATLGVTITITSGANLIRAIPTAAGNNGTLRGINSVRWDGNNGGGIPVAPGNYLVSITASASGYTNWTKISVDTNAGNYAYDPRGVAVDNNSNSLYYGRVFIGNAGTGPNYLKTPGDMDTILKLNADGTFSDDGAYGDGGFTNIFDDGNSDVPQKLRVGGR
jgi:hypothetical protein